MKRRQCNGRNPKGTGPCQSTAQLGHDDCARCGGRRKPRAEKKLTSGFVAKRPPTNSLGEPWVEGQTWTCTDCGASGPDRDDVRMPASCECVAPMQYAPPEHHSAILEREAGCFPPPPASTKDENGRTRWNPRWLAFCEASGLDENCTRDGDARASIQADFLAWTRARWADWCASQTPPLREIPPLGESTQKAFNVWLAAWVETHLDERDQAALASRERRADVTRSALSGQPEAHRFDAFARHARAAVEAQEMLTSRARRSASHGYYVSCMNGHAVRALVGLVEWMNEAPGAAPEMHQGRELLAAFDAAPAEDIERLAASVLDEESTASAGEADHGATTTEPDQLDPVESAEVVDVSTPEAQMDEHPIPNRAVEGSSPSRRDFHIAQMDCVAFLRTLGDETIDLIVTDPAYESLEKHRAIGTTTRLTADWFEIFRNGRFPELLAECFRVLKRDAHLYIYSDQETAFVTKPMAEAAGFTWWKHLVWSKTKRDSDEPAAGMGYHYRASHELIGFYEKGKRRLADLGVCDVLTAPRVKGYPTEKPVSVSRTLIEQSCPAGGLVLDCFMGSASVGEAALLAGCSFVGCDVAARSIALARERLARCGGVEVGPPPGPVPPAQGSLFG